MKKIIFVLIGFMFGIATFSQGPPMYTDSPMLLGLDGRGVRTFGKYISKENAKIYMQSLAIPFNIGNKIQAGVMTMFVNKNPNKMPSQSGIGDITAFAKYQLYQKDGKGKTFRVLAKYNQVFPTGKTDVMPPIGNDSWQSQLGLVSGYVTLKYGIYGEVNYNITSNGLPDNFMYNAAFVYPLLPQKYPPNQININIGLNGNFLTDINSNTLLFSPGIQWIPGRKILLETGVQLPLIEDVPDNQKTNFIVTLGTRILIF